MSFDRVISQVCEKLGGVELKKEQKLAVETLLERKDVMAVLPTGFGKSLIFRVYVEAMEVILQHNVSALIVVPLVGIEQDQILEAESLGISCCSLNKLKMAADTFCPKLIFASAEELQNTEFRDLLKNPSSTLNKSLELIVVDESHTIETWTGAREIKGREAKVFRAAYGDLSLLRSLCRQGTPVLALTGTADDNTIKTISDNLVLRNATVIKLSPNRKNLRFSVKKVLKGDMFLNLEWLIQMIKEKGQEMDKTIIFCNLMNDIACVINHLMLKLGKSAYSPEGSSSPKDCILGIYHSSSWQKNKDRVVESFKGQGKIRVVVASSALSMGVNFPDVSFVLNWGPPRNILDFHQEAGRAGRDMLPSHVFLVYHGQQVSLCHEEPVRELLNAEESGCLRVAGYCSLDDKIQPSSPGHNCCSFCTKQCKCKGDKCDYSPYDALKDNSKPSPHILSRPVAQEDKDCLEEALKEVQLEMAVGGLIDEVSSHGFSQHLIQDVCTNCSKLFTVYDILETCPVFCLTHAIKILEIVQEIFLDIPNFDESMELLIMTNVKAKQAHLTHASMMDSLNQMFDEVTCTEDDSDHDGYESDELPEVWT